MTAPQPYKYHELAAALLLAGPALGLLYGYLMHKGFFDSYQLTTSYVVNSLLQYGLWFGFYYCIWRGYHWAKVLYMVEYGLKIIAIFTVRMEMSHAQFFSPANFSIFLLLRLVDTAAAILILMSLLKERHMVTGPASR